jgi:hypothetical protein
MISLALEEDSKGVQDVGLVVGDEDSGLTGTQGSTLTRGLMVAIAKVSVSGAIRNEI